jgi:UDP-N-acetylmuramate: L-alanyl-gamma-D-glutamyl-meso-diaminopimelate ligase
VTNVFQDRFAQSLALADLALIGQVHRAERMPKEERIDPVQMIQFIRSQGKEGEAFSSNQELGAYLKEREFAEPDEKLLVVFFSNGSFDGVIQEFVELAESDFVPS